MSTPYVRPDVQSFLDMLAATPRPPFTAEVLAMIRKLPPGSMPSMDLPVGELAEIRDFSIPSPAGDLAIRLFDARTRRDPGPAMVFFHGGGFCVGSIDTHAGMAAALARGLDLPVISVEYRLAPENPWPAAPDDAEAAVRWVAENGATLGRDLTGIILCGDSAGGNLTIVTALALRDKPAALPVILQAALYPATDHSKPYPSRTEFGDGYSLNTADMKLFDAHYAGDRTHWRSSPLLADQSGMPPTLVVTAGLDPLRDEGRAYAAKTTAAGIPTTFREIPGMIHGFASYRSVIPSACDDVDLTIALIRSMLQQNPLQ